MKHVEQKGAIRKRNGETSVSHSGLLRMVGYRRQSYVDVVEQKRVVSGMEEHSKEVQKAQVIQFEGGSRSINASGG